MFTDHELIRIYYALEADTELRRVSKYVDQFHGEIEHNGQIMKKIAHNITYLVKGSNK